MKPNAKKIKKSRNQRQDTDGTHNSYDNDRGSAQVEKIAFHDSDEDLSGHRKAQTTLNTAKRA